MTADYVTPDDSDRTCLDPKEQKDALRALCVAADAKATPCPYASLARQCVAGRLNLLVALQCAPKDISSATKTLQEALDYCCNPDTPLSPQSASAADCAGKMAYLNTPKDFADADAAAKTCDAKGLKLPAGGAPTTAGSCAVYLKQWSYTATAAKTECTSGFCYLELAAPKRRLF
jgi:hypothetical protein